MNKEKVCTSAYFIEVYRWFNEKLSSWSKKHEGTLVPSKWVDMLKNSHVYCREEDENGKPIGNWFRIVGIEDHGPNVTLRICKPDGKIEI